ncbi:hypothetical protein ACFOY5_20795 [Massilia aurea]|uniref:hypothetical protein n=1 Tax=Massilia aurea TaxID=373040 RepID=UPI0021632C3F|nr:hypothetical protein [Massilia aurea]MCS0710015.1 hypothetical protein [Massilia aurea]
MNNQAVAQVTLHNNTGNSDKIYECVVVRSGDLYLVNTQSGRRGGSMTPRTKTKQPVSLEAAMKIYDGVVKEKKAESYYVLEGDVAVAAPAASNDPTGAFHQPQLLNDIDRDAAMALIEDDEWVMEEKMDGKRIATAISASDISHLQQVSPRMQHSGADRHCNPVADKRRVCGACALYRN